MLAYRQGDAGAFETLYARHKGPLYRFMLRSVKERALAEELYQEIWMRVIEARGRYSVQAKFIPGSYTIHCSTASPIIGASAACKLVRCEGAERVAHRSFERRRARKAGRTMHARGGAGGAARTAACNVPFA